MIKYPKQHFSIKLLCLVGLILLTLTSCREEPAEGLVLEPPTQRVTATKTMYLGIYGSRPPFVDTVSIQGKTYESAAFDSTSFQYDQQDRLIRLNLFQLYFHGSDYPGEEPKTVRTARRTEYVYEDGKLLMREGFQDETTSQVYQSRLDNSQRRIASRSWYDAAGFTTVTDTLQTYSPEGLLTSSLRILTRAGLPRQTIRQVSTVDAGNIAQTSTSLVEQGQLNETTTYVYDLSHNGPLATTTLFGESSRNALLRATTVRYEQRGLSRYEYTYDNEYDSQGRLRRQTKYYQPPGAAQREIQTLTKFYYQ